MDPLQKDDIPYGDAWDDEATVARWTDAADRTRPWRLQLRDRIVERIAALPQGTRVLDLGAGPGLLAEHVLSRCPNVETYTLLDFSKPMMARSRARLAAYPAASFVLTSFKSAAWTSRAGGPFDCVVSMQAVHELRHKQHALPLYEQIRGVLAVPGLVLICDHTPIDDTARSAALYMTTDEQVDTLTRAGFTNVQVDLTRDTLVLYVAGRQ